MSSYTEPANSVEPSERICVQDLRSAALHTLSAGRSRSGKGSLRAGAGYRRAEWRRLGGNYCKARDASALPSGIAIPCIRADLHSV